MAKPGGGLGRAAEDGVAECLFFVSAQGAELGGRSVEPGGMRSQVALLGPHLMDTASHELTQPHERVRGEREGKGVVNGDRGKGAPVFDHECASLPLEGTVGSRHSGVIRKRREVRKEQRVDHGGEGEALEEGEGEVGQGVNREVRLDSGGGTWCLPVKWHDVLGQPGAVGPVGVRGSRPEERGEGPTEAGRCRVNGGGGADKAEGCHPSLMGEEDVERRET